MAGVTPDGRFEIMRLEDVRQAQADDIRDTLGDDVRVSPDSVLGQVLDAGAVQIASIWEALGELATALDPDQAPGEFLDGIVALSNVRARQGAQASFGAVTLTGAGGTVVPAGARVRGLTSSVVVETVETVTISGPVVVGVRALATGPLVVPAGDLTEIVTPYAGWASVTNAAALTTGRDVELDAQLRARRESSAAVTGGGTDPAIRAALLEIEPTQQVVVISNRTSVALASGQPPHSVRAVVYPDSADPEVEELIARALAGARGARGGIRVWGEDEVATVTLTSGQELTVAWDYATAIGVWVSVALTLGPLAPDDVEDQVEAAILEYLEELLIGEDVRPLRLAQAVQGVSEEILDASITLGTAPAPVGTTAIAIDEDEIGIVGAADAIVVTVTP